MQNDVTTPKTEFYWLKALFGIIDYLGQKGIMNATHLIKAVDRTPANPRGRILGGIISKMSKIVNSDTLELINGEEQFSMKEEENAMKYINNVFPYFLDCDLYKVDEKPDISKIYVLWGIRNKKEAFIFSADFISQPTLKQNSTYNTELKPSSTIDEEYIAYYLYRFQVPLLGYAIFTWEKDIKQNPIRLYEATLIQYAENTVERNFTTLKPIHKVYKPSNSEPDRFIYYPTFQEQNEIQKDPVLYQAIIDITMSKRDIIFGSFASLRENHGMTPSAGWVLLIKGTKEDYVKSKKLLGDYSASDAEDANEYLKKNFWAAQYFLIDKVLTINKSLFEKIDDLPTFQNWSNLIKLYIGNYRGSFYFNNSENQTTSSIVIKQQFALEILPTGYCSLYFDSNSEKVPGLVRVDGSQLNFFFRYHESTGTYLFKFIIYAPSDSVENYDYIGVFSGTVPTSKANLFAAGIITVRKHLTSSITYIKENTEFQKEVDITKQKDLLEEYNNFLLTNYAGFTDGFIIRNLLNNVRPVDVEHSSMLRNLKLRHHYKYITFRVPKTEHSGIEADDSFRIEKCDLTFNENFTEVTVVSKKNKYIGKTYYNNKVLLIILNSVNDPIIQDYPQYTPPDSYFIIQIVLPYPGEEPSTFTDFLFGTSMWKGNNNLEAKMITLVRPYINETGETDNTFENYIIGTHGQPNYEVIDQVLIEDKKYLGAFSYIIGRSNRTIRATSSHAKSGMYRPRDKYNREPYLFAALHANELAKNASNNVEKMKYINRAKRYFFEAYMHQYGANYHAGIPIDENFYVEDEKIMERMRDIKEEQEILKIAIKRVNDQELITLMKKLWPYLDMD